jgi:hypothetical protein
VTRPVGRPVTKPCGTPDSTAAYKRHLRHDETPCDHCKAEWATAQRRYYAKRNGIAPKQ